MSRQEQVMTQGKLRRKSAFPDAMGEAHWSSIKVAADALGVPSVRLRRIIERHAVRAADGSVEAYFDGIYARKLGRLWRVHLGEKWQQ